MKHQTIDQSLVEFDKSIAYHCKLFGFSRAGMRNKFKSLGIYHKFANTCGKRTTTTPAEYSKNPKFCELCGKVIPYKNRTGKFCSRQCSATWSNANRPLPSEELKQRLSNVMSEKYARGEISVPKNPNVGVRTEKQCQLCGKSFLVRPSESRRRFCSKECGNKMDRRGISGGYRPTAGRGKSGWYKGIFCNSSWELSWVIYSMDHGVVFTRNTTGFDYTIKGKPHRYYPDFLLNDGVTFVEVKGYKF